MHSCWHTSRILALIIACIACSDVALAQRGRGSRGTTTTAPAPTPNPSSPPVEENPYGADQPALEPPTPLGSTRPTRTQPAAPAPVPAPAPAPAASWEPTPAESAASLESPTAESTDAAAPEPEAEEEDRHPGRVKFHAAGMSIHGTMFATEAEYGYSLLGPAVTYTYYVGRTWGFGIHGSIYFPLSGRYAGGIVDERGGLREPYDVRRVGLDGLVMAATRRELSEKLALLFGFGVHVQSFKLVGTNYIALDGITGGIGLLGRLDYRITDLVSIGAHLSAGFDPLDFVRHENRAVFTNTVSGGFSLGLTFE